MACIHLIEGPVGAGKSTYAKRLSQQKSVPWINLDDWIATLFSPDRPDSDRIGWYIERKSRCIEQIWKISRALLDCGSDIILELGLIRRSDRSDFFAMVEQAELDLTIHLLDVPYHIRKARVMERNITQGDTYAMTVSEDIFNMASNLWEPLDAEEAEQYTIVHVSNTL